MRGECYKADFKLEVEIVLTGEGGKTFKAKEIQNRFSAEVFTESGMYLHNLAITLRS